MKYTFEPPGTLVTVQVIGMNYSLSKTTASQRGQLKNQMPRQYLPLPRLEFGFSELSSR